MKRGFLLVLALLCYVPVFSAQFHTKLVVVVVVDQMRADYLERDPNFTGGFKRLSRQGAVFTEARHNHIPTETGPGHAAIATGRAPISHGIVANEWYDRFTGTETYCVGDAKFGKSPLNLVGPTFADALKAADPKARVYSISGKDRATILLGGRNPNVALWFDRGTRHFVTSSYYKYPQWVDSINTEIDKQAGITSDEAVERLLNQLIEREHIGRGQGTDLLMVSFSQTDFVGHKFGITGPQMVQQLASLDQILGRLMDKFEKASEGSILMALTADHGAIPALEDDPNKTLKIRKLDWSEMEKNLEDALQARWPAPGKKWIVYNNVPHLYLNHDLSSQLGLDWSTFCRMAAEIIQKKDFVFRAISSGDIAALNLKDKQAAMLKRSIRSGRSGDVIVLLAENVLLHDQPTGTSHGTMWDYDTHVPLVFFGQNISAGHYPFAATPLDIAPTIAKLIGFYYEAGDGAMIRREFEVR